MKVTIFMLSALLLVGCAHSINITPSFREIAIDDNLIQTPVGYYISTVDREKKTEQKTSGGDSIIFNPYMELEPGIQKVLFDRFRVVRILTSSPTPNALKDAHVKLAFIPEFTTETISSGFFTWPPRKFAVKCSIRAVGPDGKVIWSQTYEGVGEAGDNEIYNDFGIAAKRAAEDAFKKFARDLHSTKVFSSVGGT